MVVMHGEFAHLYRLHAQMAALPLHDLTSRARLSIQITKSILALPSAIRQFAAGGAMYSGKNDDIADEGIDDSFDDSVAFRRLIKAPSPEAAALPPADTQNHIDPTIPIDQATTTKNVEDAILNSVKLLESVVDKSAGAGDGWIPYATSWWNFFTGSK
jgi:hypothetical protein